METRGRKPKYETPEKLRAAIAAYMTDCEKEDTFPDYAGMCLALKISKRTLAAYCDPEQNENAEAFKEVLDEAAAMRESYLVRIMVTDNKRAQGCLNALKQKENGGYTDRPPESNEKTLKVQILGCGGWDAFK
jgi:hypothetical protein